MACNTPVVAYYGGVASDGKFLMYYGKNPPNHWKMILMNCGKCEACRISHSKKWAVRCMNEYEYWNEACFITLTYNNDCLPRKVHTGTGEIAPSLVRKHIQEFNKRLRRALELKGFKGKIKLFYAGEYGDLNHRPHYHLLCYGFKPTDLVKHHQDKFGFWLHTSEFLSSLWYEKVPNDDKKVRRKWKRVSRGFITVGAVNFQTCSYVAKYVLKKQTKKENEEVPWDLEFLGCSHGIGKQWFLDNYKTVMASGYMNYVNVNGDICKCAIPRYYINLLKDISPELYHQYYKKVQAYLYDKVYSFEEEYAKLDIGLSNEKAMKHKTKSIKRSIQDEENLQCI